MGRDPWRRGHGRSSHRPSPAPLPRGEHPWQLLPDAPPHRTLQDLKLRRVRITRRGSGHDELIHSLLDVCSFRLAQMGSFQPALTMADTIRKI